MFLPIRGIRIRRGFRNASMDSLKSSCQGWTHCNESSRYGADLLSCKKDVTASLTPVVVALLASAENSRISAQTFSSLGSGRGCTIFSSGKRVASLP
ncbi:hypothetical protein BJX96DRAFT_159311 [Aspergillus floccosus]